MSDSPIRHCFRLQVKPEQLSAYVQAHREVWPEMLGALRATGWQNYSIFIDDDGLLVGYFECEAGADPLAEMAKLDVNARWQSAMAKYFDGSDTTSTDGFRLLSEVFNLETQLNAVGDLAAANLKTEKDK